jgi:uncharacterized protein YhdP
MTAVLRYLLRKFYLLFAIALITLAVLVQAGRSFSPLISDYRTELAGYIGEQLNAQVSLGSVRSEWEGLKPVLEVGELTIRSHSDEPILAFREARLRLDLLRSLLNWRLVWGGVTLQETALEFEQTAEGFWHIPGLPISQAAPQAAQLDRLVDMLLLANKIELQRSQLVFRFAEGHHIDLTSPSLLLENTGEFHRLSLAVDIEERKEAVSLMIEGTGDPRDQPNFKASGFLALNDFPTSEPLAAASALLLGDITPLQLRSEGALNARLWFSSRTDNQGFDITGELGLQTLLVPVFEQEYQLDSFSTGINGYWLRSGAWQLTLAGVDAGLQDARINNVNLAVSAAAFKAPLQIQLDQIKLADWMQVLEQAGIPGEGPLGEVLRTLQPRGELNNLQVTLPLNNLDDWQLEATAEQVAVNAWRGVPALTGVDGYLKAGQRGGFINLDSQRGFSMHFDPTYAQAMHYQSAGGQVAWHLQHDKNQIYVNSGALHLRNETEEATGYVWLALPWQRNTGDIDLYLHIGGRNLDAGLYAKYLPERIPESLSNWLIRSLGEDNSGTVTKAGFLFRGTLNTPNRMARSHQLALDVVDAGLNYHPDWPALRNLSGQVLVNDSDVDARITAGTLYNSQLLPTLVTTRPNPAGEGALLSVKGRVRGSASDGLRVLREGYLRQYIGESMDTWSLSGGLLASLDLAVPLLPGAAGTYQQIDIDLNAPTFNMDNFQLSLRNIGGRISYNHAKGLASDGLNGLLFDEPLKAKLSSRREQDSPAQTLIELEGNVAAEALAFWSNRPEIFFLQGNIPHKTRVELTHRQQVIASENEATAVDSPEQTAATNPPIESLTDRLLARIVTESDLSGVAVKLPAPYGKSSEGQRLLITALDIHEQTSTIAVDYTEQDQPLIRARMQVQRFGEQLLGANIALGSNQVRLPNDAQFLVSGYLPSLVLDEWQQQLQRYREYSARLAPVPSDPVSSAAATSAQASQLSASGMVAGLPLRAELTLGSHILGPLKLEDLALTAWQQKDIWHLTFANPQLVGSLQLPSDRSKPMTIAVQELHLTRSLLGQEEIEGESLELDAELVLPESTTAIALAQDKPSFHPRNLPLADVRVDALYLDGNNYGNWSLQLRPDDKGALFDNIRGNIRGLAVGGIQARRSENDSPARVNQRGAQLYWLVDDKGARTRFIGSLSAGDMADVMRAWNKPDMIESTSANYQVDLTWPGAPGEFALVNLDGDIELLLKEGRFTRNTGAGDGILRLFALVNFDSLARRLRLDFSDLYKSGLTYDEMRGKLQFADGKIYFVEPLQVQSPSSRLQMAGSINLYDETIDARLVAALPVAGNLTFLTALATGLPAAAGIYVVSKLFRKQVDQAASVSYSIKGDWDDPTMKFDRLFESEESLRGSVNSKKESSVNPEKAVPEPATPEAATPKPMPAAN